MFGSAAVLIVGCGSGGFGGVGIAGGGGQEAGGIIAGMAMKKTSLQCGIVAVGRLTVVMVSFGAFEKGHAAGRVFEGGEGMEHAAIGGFSSDSFDGGGASVVMNDIDATTGVVLDVVLREFGFEWW